MGLLQMGVMYLGFSVLHLAQLVMAVTVIGLYAPDLQRANKVGGYVDGKWVCLSITDEDCISWSTDIFHYRPTQSLSVASPRLRPLST
jgi:hypothetical protein